MNGICKTTEAPRNFSADNALFYPWFCYGFQMDKFILVKTAIIFLKKLGVQHAGIVKSL